MPRKAREFSETGIYHVMLRGNERKAILANDLEKQYFISCLSSKQKECKFSIYAYCVMDNHVHLLINVLESKLSSIMKGMATRYAYFYNNQHRRVGHVFQDRFKSEPIKDERYLLGAVRYIHNNPVKANIVLKAEDYTWSSYRIYLKSRPSPSAMADSSFVLGIISKDRENAIEEFKRFSEDLGEDNFLDIEEKPGIDTLEEGREYLQNYLTEQGKIYAIETVKDNKELRQKAIVYLLCNTQLSQRKIAALLGIDKSIVEKVKR